MYVLRLKLRGSMLCAFFFISTNKFASLSLSTRTVSSTLDTNALPRLAWEWWECPALVILGAGDSHMLLAYGLRDFIFFC